MTTAYPATYPGFTRRLYARMVAGLCAAPWYGALTVVRWTIRRWM